MIIFIVFLLFGVYIASFWKVCNIYTERKISPFGILPWIILLVPIINTLYWLIVGADWKLKNNENLVRMFGKLPEKEKEEKIMKKVYFYIIIEDCVDVDESGGDYGSSVYYSLNGNSVVHMSEYFDSFEECSDSRNYIIKNYPSKAITPIIEGLI